MTPSTSRRLGHLALLFALLTGIVPNASVSGPHPDELRRVKAAFILNIARFVSWPADADNRPGSPLRLCFFRSNPLGSAVETIRGKKVGERQLTIATISNLEEGRQCQILFVPPSELDRFTRLASSTLGPTLTLTDNTTGSASANRRGIIITLVRNGTRIGFEIDLKLAGRARLKMSAELLKLARIVGEP